MRRFLLLLSIVSQAHAMSHDVSLQDSCITPSLTQQCSQLVPDSILWCMELRDLRNSPESDVLLSQQSSIWCSPASVTKLITCAAALDMLGGEYRFSTILAFDHSQSDTLQDGSLVSRAPLRLIPGGDPTLTHQGLGSLLERAPTHLADSIASTIELCYGRYPDAGLGPGWMWDDGDGSWAARPSAATIDGNCLQLYGVNPLRLNVQGRL